jgi:DNA polymerase bacteriophage-type
MKSRLHIDFETYCDLDLKKVGVHRYVEHPSFHVIAAAWKLDAAATTWTTSFPSELARLLASADIQGHAWNAAFETAVLDRLGVTVANPLSCTMQRGLAYGLPGSLDSAGKALELSVTKDLAGHRLMLRMSRPQKPDDTPWVGSDYARLGEYCARDVESEAAIAAVIPELQPEEAELSRLDARMNVSGELRIDRGRVLALREAAAAAEKIEAARCAVLTAGTVTSPGTQTMRLLAWLASQGIILPDTTRTTIDETLACSTSFTNDVMEVLGIRLRAARASTRKLERMLDMASPVGALQGQFQFCGAGRTGRWSGRGVQVQNLPRVPKGFDPERFVSMAEKAVQAGFVAQLDMVAPYPVLDCVSWSLRSCLRGPGSTIWSIDFSQIEARVLAWLAGQQDVLDVFRSGADVYIWAAKAFGSDDRQLGKVLILALGYGMGAVKLRDTAWKTYKVRMTAAEAMRFHTGWRLKNPRIVGFWDEIEIAAKQAVLNRGRVFAAGGSGVAFQSTVKTLQLRLPSGRVLYYHQPHLTGGTLCYWGTEAGGRWGLQRTWGGKLAENATQAIARDVMSEAMLRVFNRTKLVPAMTVHDELVYVSVGPQQGIDLADIIREAPPWAGGLPIAGESKMMSRYGIATGL